MSPNDKERMLLKKGGHLSGDLRVTVWALRTSQDMVVMGGVDPAVG